MLEICVPYTTTIMPDILGGLHIINTSTYEHSRHTMVKVWHAKIALLWLCAAFWFVCSVLFVLLNWMLCDDLLLVHWSYSYISCREQYLVHVLNCSGLLEMLMLYHISLVSVIKLCQCIIIITLFIWLEGFSLLCLITCCDSTVLSWLLLPGLAGHVFSLVYQAKECHLFKMVFYYILFVQSQKAEHHADPPKLCSFSTNDCYPS